MNHLYIDCFSGISGDMFLGALIDAGLPLAALKRDLQKIKVKGYQIKVHKVHRGTIQATKCDVLIQKGFANPLSFPDIRQLISTSQLCSLVKKRSLEAFDTLAETEATVHGVPVSKVHFHEVGVIDSLIDIVGAFLGCAYLEIEKVSASAVNVGSGTIPSAHGTLPVPGPAVAHLAKGVPIFSAGPPTELTTPTGMCILKILTGDFQTLPRIHPNQIGYGAGTDDPKGWPNVLRVFLSRGTSMPIGISESIIEVQTNVDDLNPQVYEVLIERLLQAGALDVTLNPVIMKRSRPGTVVTALASPDVVENVTRILFEETTTLGVRINELQRRVLPRETRSVRLPDGEVRVKIANMEDGTVKITPEFQDCRQVAEKAGRPVRDILDEARKAFIIPGTIKETKRKRKKDDKKIL